MIETQSAIIELIQELKRRNFHFITVTPESHRRYLKKNGQIRLEKVPAPILLRDLFGWNRAVPQAEVDKKLVDLMARADVLRSEGEFLTSAVRFSAVDDQVFVHSSYPTIDSDSVFFGPDTYRYIRFVKEKIVSARTVLDIGCGSGAGGLTLARHLWKSSEGENNLERLFLTDINERALEMTRINSLSQDIGVPVEIFSSDLLKGIPKAVLSSIDTIIANPPFIIDEKERAYRHGGGLFGAQLSLDIVRAALDSLAPGGQLALYTGVSVVDGVDVFKKELQLLFKDRSLKISYEEIDPDIFGEELDMPAYRDVERIAAVGLHIEVI
jgi:methylase of polypeptide subunit release factors